MRERNSRHMHRPWSVGTVCVGPHPRREGSPPARCTGSHLTHTHTHTHTRTLFKHTVHPNIYQMQFSEHKNAAAYMHNDRQKRGNLANWPHAHMSTGLPYGSFLNTSGDKYPGVPAKPAKIHTFFIFSGFLVRKMSIMTLSQHFSFSMLSTFLHPDRIFSMFYLDKTSQYHSIFCCYDNALIIKNTE